MKGKLFVLVGKSGCGKSTLESIITRNQICEKYISCTTRKRRSYEVDHEHYHFITEFVFKAYLLQDQFIEWSTYETVNGLALYGLNKNDLSIDKNNQVVVVNPNGLEKLEQAIGRENIVSIYIDRDDKERVISALQRDNNDFENTLDEVHRRFKADVVDFEGIEDKVDYIIKNNSDAADMLSEFVDILEKESILTENKIIEQIKRGNARWEKL